MHVRQGSAQNLFESHENLSMPIIGLFRFLDLSGLRNGDGYHDGEEDRHRIVNV